MVEIVNTIFLFSLSLGERVGTATLLCSSVEERQLVESQMKLIIRPMWSNPPINGARIATELLTNLDYKEQW